VDNRVFRGGWALVAAVATFFATLLPVLLVTVLTRSKSFATGAGVAAASTSLTMALAIYLQYRRKARSHQSGMPSLPDLLSGDVPPRLAFDVFCAHLREQGPDKHMQESLKSLLRHGKLGVLNIDLRGATLIDFDLSGCRVGTASFEAATFLGTTNFDSTDFLSHALFSAASFSGPASFRSVSFGNSTAFDRVSFMGPTTYTQAQFVSGATFAESTFRDGVDFALVRFEGPLSCELVTFAAGVTFRGTRFDGDASFKSTSVEGQADFSLCHFGGPVRFQNAVFSGDVSFENSVFLRDTDYRAAKALNPMFLSGVEFPGANGVIGLQAVDREVPVLGELEADNATGATLLGGERTRQRLTDYGLTNREVDVLLLLADGLTDTDIADRLLMSQRSVQACIARIQARTGVNTRPDLVNFCESARSGAG